MKAKKKLSFNYKLNDNYINFIIDLLANCAFFYQSLLLFRVFLLFSSNSSLFHIFLEEDELV